MHWLWALVVVLVALGSVLAIAETSVSRITSVRAMALREAGRRNAETLLWIESDPAPYLNAIYLCVMFVQNGSAILVGLCVGKRIDVGVRRGFVAPREGSSPTLRMMPR